jgi:hypothetical protein
VQCKKAEKLFQDVLYGVLLVEIMLSFNRRQEILDENELAVG